MKLHRLLIFIAMFFLFNKECLSQSDEFKIDLIIVVNNELEVGTISNLRLIVKREGGEEIEIDANYYPGSLSFNTTDYENLFSIKNDSAFISFNHKSDSKHKQSLVNYEIPFYKEWIRSAYIIIRVYDLSKGKYKKAFEPLSNSKNYTYELDYVGGIMRRERKKK